MMPNNDELSDVNMTPLVDVMLVLLIVFIIAAPLIVPQAMGIQLPATEPVRSEVELEQELIYIYADGSFSIAEQSLDLDELRAWFAEQPNPSARIVVHADESVPYGRVAQVMAMAQNMGVEQITFRTTIE